MANNFGDLPSELLPRDLMECAAYPSTIPNEALLSIILKTEPQDVMSESFRGGCLMRLDR